MRGGGIGVRTVNRIKQEEEALATAPTLIDGASAQQGAGTKMEGREDGAYCLNSTKSRSLRVVVGHLVYQAKKEEEQINIVCFVNEY